MVDTSRDRRARRPRTVAGRAQRESPRAVDAGTERRAPRVAGASAEGVAPGAVDGMRAEPIDLAGHPGLVIRPASARALYVLAHGAGAGMRSDFLSDMSGALAARGIATLRWEFPYMAAGKRRPDRAEVAEAAVHAVWSVARARFGELALFAGGKSFGGRMTSRAHAAAPLANLRGLVFLGFPLHPPDRPGVERAEHLAQASGPMLFVQGDRDELAGLRRLRPIVRALGSRATLHVVAAADHGFDVQVRSGRTRAEVREEIADMVASWITQRAPHC